MNLNHSELEQASKILHERDYLKKALTSLHEDPLITLGYAEDAKIPEDIVETLRLWTCLVLVNADREMTEQEAAE